VSRATVVMVGITAAVLLPQGCQSDAETSSPVTSSSAGGSQPGDQCSDGTPAGQCSAAQPERCEGGTLVAACAICGCAAEGACQADGSCQTIPSCDDQCQNGGFASGVCRTSPRDPDAPPLPTPLPAATGPADTWHTHPDLVSMFQALVDTFPGYAASTVIGTTTEGNDITMFELGNPDGGRVLWDGCLHGWEDLGSEVMYLIARWLLEGQEALADTILARNHILFVPVVNMDSYERQNRNLDQCSYGVDLNRNFVNGWNSTACGDYPDCYNGVSAGSELETQGLRDVFATVTPRFYLNTHYGGGPWLGHFSGNDTDVVNAVEQRISEISAERGVTPYQVSEVGANGMAVGDAGDAGVQAWLIEVASGDGCYSHTAHTYDDVVDTYFPKMLPILIAMCEACEAPPPAPRCQPRESSIGQSSCAAEQDCCCR